MQLKDFRKELRAVSDIVGTSKNTNKAWWNSKVTSQPLFDVLYQDLDTVIDSYDDEEACKLSLLLIAEAPESILLASLKELKK